MLAAVVEYGVERGEEGRGQMEERMDGDMGRMDMAPRSAVFCCDLLAPDCLRCLSPRRAGMIGSWPREKAPGNFTYIHTVYLRRRQGMCVCA